MSQLLAHLKSTTQPQHDQLETVSYAKEIMSQRISRQAYFQLLQKSAIIYQMLEPVVENYITNHQHPRFAQFTSHRLTDLKKDLAYFKQEDSQIQPIPPTPFEINSLPELIGVLYVLEGARLGGKVIVKALQKNSELSDVPGFHFYQQAEIDTRQRWLNFRNLADQAINHEEAITIATQSAQRVFNFFYKIHASDLKTD